MNAPALRNCDPDRERASNMRDAHLVKTGNIDALIRYFNEQAEETDSDHPDLMKEVAQELQDRGRYANTAALDLIYRDYGAQNLRFYSGHLNSGFGDNEDPIWLLYNGSE
jgi:hypothetical protein